ncbi:MAG: DUF481 domain-containing protein [Kiritimatiellales bacterium]|nr:DUF481 domain-containing protein [Kiritimatiellales bacterium]MCF7864271.1 DUF481 domain-containing protein [Kiritimatiellales bacterium]
MTKKLFYLLIALSTSATGFAEDTIVFKNGDVLTGTILKQDAEHVYFKSGSFGSVGLNTSDITEIRIETPTLGEVAVPVDAIAAPEPTNSTPVAVAAPAPTASVLPPQQDPQQPTEKSKWSGQAGMAVAIRNSNTLRRTGDTTVEQDQQFESYRVYGNVDWDGEKNDLKWDWTYRYSSTDLRKDDDYFNVTQNYQHDFTQQYYASAKTMYQRDFRRGIQSEHLQTAELGINWFDQPTVRLSTSLGGGYHQYDRIQGNYSDAQGKFIIDESFRWQVINSLSLFQKYTHLGDFEKYHFVFTSGLENKLMRDVFLRLEYRLDRDTEVNYNDSAYYDKALLTSVLYKF